LQKIARIAGIASIAKITRTEKIASIARMARIAKLQKLQELQSYKNCKNCKNYNNCKKIELNCRADMREDISFEHILLYLELDSFDDNFTDASNESGLRLPSGQPFEFGVSADEESVVGVRRRDAGNTDSGLGENVVHRQGDDVLSFHR
jgi:hypothetical protein